MKYCGTYTFVTLVQTPLKIAIPLKLCLLNYPDYRPALKKGEGNVINGIHAMADGGVPGYSSIVYINSECVAKKQTSRV